MLGISTVNAIQLALAAQLSVGLKETRKIQKRAQKIFGGGAVPPMQTHQTQTKKRLTIVVQLCRNIQEYSGLERRLKSISESISILLAR